MINTGRAEIQKTATTSAQSASLVSSADNLILLSIVPLLKLRVYLEFIAGVRRSHAEKKVSKRKYRGS
jgi:hypothetical protein